MEDIIKTIDKYLISEEDITNVNSKDKAEMILKKKNIKWDKAKESQMGGVLYSHKGKNVAFWFKTDDILTIW